MQQAFILEAPKLEGEELGFDKLGCYNGKLLLYQLETGNGSIKLDASFGVVESSFIASACSPGRAPCDAVACFIQAGKRAT